MEIKSKSNPNWKIWKSLLEKKGIEKEKAFILSGKKIIEEAIKKRWPIKAYLSLDKKETSFPNFQLSRELLKELSPNQKAEDILIIERPEMKTWSLKEAFPEKALLLPIGDPANLGAALRSALAFNYKNIILLKEAASPFLPKTIKASSGSILHLNLMNGPSIHELKDRAQEILALDKEGKDLREVSIDRPLLVGEEGPGLPDFKWQKVSIAIDKNIESLNATVALSIALYEASK